MIAESLLVLQVHAVQGYGAGKVVVMRKRCARNWRLSRKVRCATLRNSSPCCNGWRRWQLVSKLYGQAWRLWQREG
ncbi:hypothetical protein JCM7447_03630 [Corynebacterium amycolatum]